MKNFVLACATLLLSGVVHAAVAETGDSGSSPYLLALAGVALVGTIAHRRNKRKSHT